MVQNRLKEIRNVLHISQTELAEKVGVGHTALSKFETGVINLTVELSCSICDYLNISLDYLYCRTNINSLSNEELNIKSEILEIVNNPSTTLEDLRIAKKLLKH